MTEAIVLSVAAFYLSSLPLTASFSYEFNAALAPIAFLTFAIGGALRLKRLESRRPVLLTDISHLLVRYLLTLCLAPALFILNPLKGETCRWGVGFAWFFLLPFTTALFGTASAAWALRRPRSSLGAVGQSLLPAGIFTLLTLRDLGLDPPLFFHNPALGFFAGPLYDEWIPIETGLVTFRFWVLLLSAWLCLQYSIFRKRFPRKVLALDLLALVTLLFPLAARDRTGWFFSAKAIRQTLSKASKGSHVTIYHEEGSLHPVEEVTLVASLDYRVAEITSRLHISLEKQKPIEVFLYSSAEQKRRFTGTRTTLIGNPMQERLHLLYTDPGDPVLKHELAHVVAAPWGIPGIGVTLKVGLLEGLATALEGYRDRLSLHEWSAALRKYDKLPDVGRVMGAVGFFSEAPSHAYLASGSFSLWLLERAGPGAMARIYRGESFDHVYGKSLGELAKGWERFISSVPLSRFALDQVQDILKDRPVFLRRCPHDVADATEKARSLVDQKKLPQALECLGNAWDWSGRTPRTTYRLATARSLASQSKEAEAQATEILKMDQASPDEKALARILLADLRLRNKDAVGALTYLTNIDTAPLDIRTRLSVWARVELLKSKEIELYKSLAEDGRSQDWFVSLLGLLPTKKLPAYFLYAGWQSIWSRRYFAATIISERLRQLSPTPWEQERILLSAKASEFDGRFTSALAEFEKLKSYASAQGDLLYIDDQIRRIRSLPQR